jgi:hypothetical protein
MPLPPIDSGLVVVEKDGEHISVHPLSLDNHLALGWTIVQSTPKSVSIETPVPPAIPKAEKPAARKI